MSIKTGKRLSRLLTVDVTGIGLKSSTGEQLNRLRFANLTNGLNMAPMVLESILHETVRQVAKADGQVATMNDLVTSETTKLLSSYMDDINTSSHPYRIGQELPPKIVDDVDSKLPLVKGSLMEMVMKFLQDRGLVCKEQKLQLLTASDKGESLGVSFTEQAEYMSFSKLSSLKTQLPEALSYRAALGYLASLTPTVTELVPPWATLLKNSLQRAIGLLVAELHELHNTNVSSVTKKIREEIWNTIVPKELRTFISKFQERFCTEESQNWRVCRGLDLSKPLEIFVDSSKDVIGYWVTQENRKLWFQQASLSRLGKSVGHINLFESLGIAYALIDVATRFVNAKIALPHIVILSDSKTALSIFRNMRTNSTSSCDLTQQALLSKLLGVVSCILTPDFLRNSVTFQFTPGISNRADELTRDELFSDINKYVEIICKRRKSSTSVIEEPDSSNADVFLLSFVDSSLSDTSISNQPVSFGSLNLIPSFSPEQMRYLLNSLPSIQPVILNYYLIRKLFDLWKLKTLNLNSSKRLSTNFCRLIPKISDSDLKLNKFNLITEFLKDQESFFSYDRIADKDGIFRSISSTEGMIPSVKILLPSKVELLYYIVSSTHRTNGHCKFNTLFEIISRNFESSSIRSICKQVCSSCIDCSISCKLTPRPKPSLHVHDIPSCPGRKLSMDIFGPLETPEELAMQTKSGYSVTDGPKYFLTLVDHFSKRRFAYPLSNSSAAAVRLGLLTNFQTEGFPTVLICDNAAYFKSLEDWCTRVGIELNFTQPYFHEANGLVERGHRDINETIRSLVAAGCKDYWVEGIFNRILVQNTSEKRLKSGNISPATLCQKFRPQLPNQQASWELTPEVEASWSILEKEYAQLWRSTRGHNRDVLNSKKSLFKIPSLSPGDRVLVFKAPRSKLDSSWREGTIKESNDYGYLLTDGTTHGYHHVKAHPDQHSVKETPTPQVVEESISVPEIDSEELVLARLKSGDKLAKMISLDRPSLTFEVVELKVYEDYSAREVGVIKVDAKNVIPLGGKLSCHKQGKDTGLVFVPRAVSSKLRALNSTILQALERIRYTNPIVAKKLNYCPEKYSSVV
jgi:hypothetical protein